MSEERSDGSKRVCGRGLSFRLAVLAQRPGRPVRQAWWCLEGWRRSCWGEADAGGWVVDVDLAGGAGPFEDPAAEVSDLPGGGVFEGVVSAAEVVEVVGAGGSAECPVLAVVDVAAVDGLAAAGESAVFVAGAEESLQVGAGGVAVDGEDAARHRVAQNPIPS
ncbi:hypothetical protein MIC448_2610001 [Microbacterium sp. C448]|nr:hypothetical protein MIC448_2610001 [Microbacterium sp. C448]